MFSVLKGDRIFVIANIESSSKNNAVLARPDAGIARAIDVKGKRIGFTPGTTSDFFLDSFLTAQGLTRLEISPVPLKPDFVQRNPQALTGLLRALIQAEDFVARHPQEAQDIVTVAVKVDKELVKEVWDAFVYQVTLDQNLLITLEDETRWAMKNKLTDKTVMPNYADYIHVDSLTAAKPEAVRLKR